MLNRAGVAVPAAQLRRVLNQAQTQTLKPCWAYLFCVRRPIYPELQPNSRLGKVRSTIFTIAPVVPSPADPVLTEEDSSSDEAEGWRP